jgi:ABC-type xylose transport system permease subunit
VFDAFIIRGTDNGMSVICIDDRQMIKGLVRLRPVIFNVCIKN